MYLPFTIKPGKKCNLDEIPSRVEPDGINKESAYEKIEENSKVMADLASKLYAENKRSILLVLQGMDAAGKDSTIRTVLRGVNPASCQVHSFKAPSAEELDHDYLWRVHKVVPRKGNIGIFNRSHYEEVLIVRVHELVPKAVWKQRYEQINQFEELLHENGTTILKCYLHISKDEQRERLQARVDDPESHWKFNPDDLKERARWDDYRAAFNECITKCNTEHAPWHVIPCDRKWYRNLVVSELLRSTLEKMKPQIPAPVDDFTGWVIE